MSAGKSIGDGQRELLKPLERDALGRLIPPTYEFDPVIIGPTWRRGEDGNFLLPKYTLGWQIIHWAETNLLMPDETDGTPWKFTAEQRRFILWLYEVDEEGVFVWRTAVLQRLKGWGKDPIAAVLALVELIGPCRFEGWAKVDMPDKGLYRGDPVAKDNPAGWVQIAAVSQKQTQNTMKLFHGLVSDDLKKKYRIIINALSVTAYGGRRQIEAVTKSPRSMEGNRPSFVILNETHHFLESNQGIAMAEAANRNATKSKGGQARRLSITNAYAPHERSYAQRQRETYLETEAGLRVNTGVLYDSLEADSDTRLTPWKDRPEKPDDMSDELYKETQEIMLRAWLSAVTSSIRGDADWLGTGLHGSVVDSILSGEDPPNTSKRFYFNVSTTPEDIFVDPAAVKLAIDRVVKSVVDQTGTSWLEAAWGIVDTDDEIVMFGDGSKSDDSTALVGCRLSDGYTFLIGLWQKPPGDRGENWLAPRETVNQRVSEAFARFNIVGFWFDPSHTTDDEEGSRYWDDYCDLWMRTYSTRLKLWATKTGHRTHAVMWDMTSHERAALFVTGAEQFKEDMEAKNDVEEFAPRFKICGSPGLVNHLGNARQYPTKWGTSLSKESRSSTKKVDAAVCAVGARMMRRIHLNQTVEKEEERTGAVWGYS